MTIVHLPTKKPVRNEKLYCLEEPSELAEYTFCDNRFSLRCDTNCLFTDLKFILLLKVPRKNLK